VGDFDQSGAKIAKNPPRWGVFKFCESARNYKEKRPVVDRPLIAGEGFEPPTFGL
jgi:hypothetical protein